MITTSVGPLLVRDTDPGGARPTLLWHSLFVDSRSWERVEPELARDRRLVVVTGPGHGPSGDPGHRYTMQDCADAAVAVLAEVGVDGPVDWVGNAWGGHVGIVLASRRPDLVRTLVTAGTPVHAYTRGGRLQTHLLLALYRAFGPVRFLVDSVTDVLLSERTRERDAAAVALVRDSFASADRRGLANAVVSISLHREDLTPALPSIQAPTLFITGSDHHDWSAEQARAAARLVPHGSSVAVEGAAYLVPLETPAEFVRSVHGFWAEHAAPGVSP
ncbi:alpha/beta fold hydrolase [Pengzhenrongella frigida]|uniref:Alpha/beta fold hydrolase n=2 Tax=Pengzhenrongella frigida TaxID=1259133 RepID=A0A4Q5MZQ2_9MICO|nr:alpha/beta fold hydrolase [Cellulomonas sp. HLT2-17]